MTIPLKVAASEVATIAEAAVGVETDASTGSGTVVAHVGRSSWVLTCAHVVADCKKASVVYRVGKTFRKVNGKVERVDAEKDLALVRVPKLPLPFLPIGEQEPDLYEKCWIVASPGGFFGTACEALLTAKDGSNGDQDEAYQLSGFSAPGASGGTIGNYNGQLVGVVTGIRHDGHRAVHGIVFATPLPKLREFLAKALITKARRARAKE